MKWVGYPLLYPVFTRRYAMEHSLVLRNQRVMLDRDLAMFYGVETRALNQQRERNPEKFPEDFAYQVTDKELDNLTRLSQNVITSTKFNPVNPWAYTLEGCNMAAFVDKPLFAICLN